MKVRTDLRSGSMIDDAANEAIKGINQMTGFINEASVEAEALTNKMVNAAKCVTSAF